jgi:hypothetical protein
MDKYKIPARAATQASITDLSPEVLQQILLILQSNQLLGGQGAQKANGKANGHANGYTNGADPRVVLPLDRDERGFNGF